MKKLFQRYWRCALAVLFLWSTDYFCQDMSVAGGFADYVSEFLVQFYYVPLIGAIILACVFVSFYSLCCLVDPDRTA